MKVTLVDYNSKGVETMVQALGICREKECTEATLERVLNAKPVPHSSALEFGWVCLKVEGVSVKTRIQLLRSRLFSTMERSTRSIDMRRAKCIVPEAANYRTPYDYEEHMEAYNYAIYVNETLENASYLLPLAVETSFFLAGNLRVFYEYFQKRLCKKHVQDEHYKMAVQMWNTIRDVFPVMNLAHPCKACGVCKEE
jgi:thymidylate synthase ThyX